MRQQPAAACWLAAVALALCSTAVAATAAAAAERGLLVFTHPELPPQTVQFDSRLNLGSPDLPFNDPLIAPPEEACVPEQVRVSYWSLHSVLVSWSTCEGLVGYNATTARPTSGTLAAVHYGTAPGRYTSAAVGNTTSYAYDYSAYKQPSYVSPFIHHVVLKSLQPGATYHYQVATLSNVTGHYVLTKSQEFSFQMPALTWPVSIGLMADPGQTFNTVATINHMEDMSPDVVVLVGDFAYADNYGANGTEGTPGTYQPRWDSWGRLFQPLLSAIPFLHTNGNHEMEWLPNNDFFTAYNHRYPTPGQRKGPLNVKPVRKQDPHPNNMYYSTRLPGVHFIALTSYIPEDDFGPASPQYLWLKQELQRIDRSITPWVMVVFHSPWYTSYNGHYKENECMRQAYEPLLVAAGVDVVVGGHVHSYERTKGVNNYKVDRCGPMHLVVGNGGNVEGLYSEFIDQPNAYIPWCDKPEEREFPDYQPQRCFSREDGAYCYKEQPAWSAYREPAFGSGVLHVVNGTHAFWSWRRNHGSSQYLEADRVWIVRDLGCRAGGAAAGGGDGGAAVGLDLAAAGGGAAAAGGVSRYQDTA